YYHSPLTPLPSVRAWTSLLGASRVSRSEAWERRLIARRLDVLQLGLQAIDRRRGLVVLVPGIGQVLADHIEGIPELIDVAADTSETALDLPRVLLDLKTAQAEHDHLQIGIEAVGRDRNDVPADGVRGGRVLLDVLVLHDDLVIDVLGRNVHQGEVEGALVGQDVALGDLIHAS